MNAVTWDGEGAEHTLPVFNYIDGSVPHSLHRNGRVKLARAPNGNDSELTGYVADPRPLTVLDARDHDVSLDRNGFLRLDAPLADPSLDFLDHEAVVRRYYAECQELMKSATGASHVFAFDHNVRWAEGQREQASAGKQKVQGPIRVVHGDYTITSGPQRLRDLAEAPRINDTMRPFLGDRPLVDPDLVEQALGEGGRFAIVNVWRSVDTEPVAKDPLGFCDAQTIEAGDLVVFELHYADRIGENYFAHYADRHQWYAYSALTRSEPVLIKQWDSEGGFARTDGRTSDHEADCCTMNFHSAFVDPGSAPDARERRSIEVRCALIWA